jgi:hypothetical protein
MTRINGHTSIASSCCKSIYKTVDYASMNFSVYAYWTDGAKDGGLMPNDGGLRVCRCGTAFLLRDAIRLEIEASPDTPFPPKPADADLLSVIQAAPSPQVEATARRNYWRHLNDCYRVLYREHREKEEAKSDAQWRHDYYASLPFLQSAASKLLRRKPRWDFPKPKRLFTVPPYTPTTEQKENMARLLTLILNEADQSGTVDQLEVAELYRELGQFEAAAEALSKCNEDHAQVTRQVMSEQIELRATAPIRYRE